MLVVLNVIGMSILAQRVALLVVLRVPRGTLQLQELALGGLSLFGLFAEAWFVGFLGPGFRHRSTLLSFSKRLRHQECSSGFVGAMGRL